jgi:hypothetical protein
MAKSSKGFKSVAHKGHRVRSDWYSGQHDPMTSHPILERIGNAIFDAYEKRTGRHCENLPVSILRLPGPYHASNSSEPWRTQLPSDRLRSKYHRS